MSEIRVLLADDHPVVRAGLRAMLDDFDDVVVAGDVADGAAALAAVTALAADDRPVDVVLMDLQMGPGMDGVTATRQIRSLTDPPQVLILTTYDTDADIKLFISEATVKTHLVHIYDKLGVDNRTAAISVARQQRIIRS